VTVPASFKAALAARVALAIALACVASDASAADMPALALDALGPHAGWMLLAGIGVLAVVLAAFTVRRPARERRSLMEATTQLRDVPDDLRANDGYSGERALNAGNDAAHGTPEPRVEPSSDDPKAAPSTALAPQSSPSASSSDGTPILLAIHHVDLSIDVLRRHLEQETRPMPAVWLMLLDLARTHGREQTFRDLAHAFHRRFNAREPAWDGYPPNRDEPGLEAYPRLVKEITRAWGTHECRRLLDRLLYDTRGGDRKGFTLNAYNDLVALRRAADAVLDTIEQDLAEEANIRSAFASAQAEIAPDDLDATARSPLVRELESELESDLRSEPQRKSALEREHPALARMLAREWGNAALSVRLCEMLARGGDGAHRLSKEAGDELETLRTMAEKLASVNGIEVPKAE
jgi:hypothetical protein